MNTKRDLVYVFAVITVIPSMVSRIIKRAKALLSSSREKERHKALAKEIALWMKEKEASPE